MRARRKCTQSTIIWNESVHIKDTYLFTLYLLNTQDFPPASLFKYRSRGFLDENNAVMFAFS